MYRRRRWIGAAGFAAIMGVVVYSSIFPTGGFYFDGEPRPCELHVRVVDSEGRSVAGVTAELVYSRGSDVVRTEYKPGATDADGRIDVPMMLGGDSGSEINYVWGLATRSQSGFGRNGWQFVWRLIDLRGPELRSALLLRGADGARARVPEADLMQLPVDRRIPLDMSVFKDDPRVSQFSRDGSIDVLSLAVMIVRRKGR